MRNPSMSDTDLGAGIGGLGAPSYAQRVFGSEFSVDLQQVQPGHFRATVNTDGNSYANRVFGNHFQVDGERGDDYYRGAVSTQAPKTLGMGRRRTRGTLKAVSARGGMSPRGGGSNRCEADCISKHGGGAEYKLKVCKGMCKVKNVFR